MTKARLAQPEFVEMMSPDELFLDGKNPRLAEYAGGEDKSQFELLRTLWQG